MGEACGREPSRRNHVEVEAHEILGKNNTVGEGQEVYEVVTGLRGTPVAKR